MNALLLFLVGALAVLPGLSATTKLVMSFKEVIDESVLVARVRIQKMTPVHYAAKDRDRICGHRFSFSPVEVFKSDASPSDSFFAEAGSDYRGNEVDYLVLVFSHGTQTPDEALAQLHGGDEEELRRLRCVLSERRYALAEPTTMIPIEPLADDSPQPWLRLRDPTIFPIHAIGEGDLRERGPEMLVRWEAAASLIRQVIEKKADP